MAPGGVATASRGPSKLQTTAKVRYWKGKPQGAELDPEDSDEDSDEDEEESAVKKRKRIQAQQQAEREAKLDKDVVAGGAGRVLRTGATGIVKVDLRNVEVGKAMPVKQEAEESEEETDDEEEEEEVKPKITIPKPPGSESSEYETDSEEESDEEKKPAFRPVFVKKDLRGMTAEKAQALAEEKIRQEEELRDQRKNDSKEIAGETIRRELAEKESSDIVHDIDDTDGLDPTAEFESWRARELTRLLRDKQAQAAKDEEQAEIERRRAMPEEQRLREDMEYADATRAQEKGEMGFLQKYYHRGAFHGDDELLKRDTTGATESAVDVSMLPKVMQVKDFGKASRTKYTHLADQDTSAGGWGNAARLPASMGMGASNPNGPGGIGTTQTGCWNCGGPHVRSACPNQNINDPLVLAGVPNLGAPPMGSSYGAPFGAGMGMGQGRPGMGQGRPGQAQGSAGPPMVSRPQDAGYSQRGGARPEGDTGARGGHSGGDGRDDRARHSGRDRREERPSERRDESERGPSRGQRSGGGEERRSHRDDDRGERSSRDRPPPARDEGRHRDDDRRRDDRKRPRSPDGGREGREGDDRRRRDKERDADGRGGDDRRRRDERDRDRDRDKDRDRNRDRERR